MSRSRGRSQTSLLRPGIIFILLLIIIAAISAQYLLRPDRGGSFTIIYTGDIQGAVSYSTGEHAGYEKIAAIASEAESEGKTLLIDAGGCLGGSEEAETDNGLSMISVMNAAGYDAFIPGPKDFVYGIDTLLSLRSEAAFPFLAANLVRGDGTRLMENYTVISDGDIRIGLIGVTSGISGQTAERASVTVLDPVETAQTAVDELKKNTDAIIVAAYTGNEEITRKIADIEGVCLVVESGASLPNAVQTENGTWIVSAGRNGEVVGEAQIRVRRGKVSVEINEYGPEDFDKTASDDTVLSAVNSCLKNKEALEKEIVGVFENGTFKKESGESSDESGSRPVQIETDTGDMVTDAMLYAAAADGAEIALITGSSIMGDLKDGSVTCGELNALFEDSQNMVLCKMTGGELRKLLEESFSSYPDVGGCFQVAGLSLVYSRDTGFGSALSEITVGNHNLDDARTYTVAMTNDMLKMDESEETAWDVVAYYKCMGTIMNAYVSRMSGFTLEMSADTDIEDIENADNSTQRIVID